MLQTVCLFLFSPADRAGQPKEPNSRARATGRDTYAEYNDPAWGRAPEPANQTKKAAPLAWHARIPPQ